MNSSQVWRRRVKWVRSLHLVVVCRAVNQLAVLLTSRIVADPAIVAPHRSAYVARVPHGREQGSPLDFLSPIADRPLLLRWHCSLKFLKQLRWIYKCENMSRVKSHHLMIGFATSGKSDLRISTREAAHFPNFCAVCVCTTATHQFYHNLPYPT